MLVKHNISKYTASQMIGRAWSVSGDIYVGTERVVQGNKYRFRNTANLEGQEAFFGLSILPIDNENYQGLDDIYYYIDLENTGIHDLKMKTDHVDKEFNVIKAGERKEIKFSSNRATTLRIYSIANKEDWHEIVLHKYMAASSPIDIYLPILKAIPEDKQALLPQEGNFKEIKSI